MQKATCTVVEGLGFMYHSIAQKWCPRCEKTKEINAFRADKALKDGYRKYCKDCCSKDTKRTCRECKVVMKRDEMVQSSLHNSLYYCVPCWSKLQGKKKCISCKEIKDVDEFNLDKSRPDGREYYCKACCQEKHDKKYAKEIIKKGKKRCVECKQSKSLFDFEEDRRSRDGFSVQCKNCLTGKTKEKKEVDRSREYQDFTISNTTAKRLKHIYKITKDDYRLMFEQQKGLCAICGKSERKSKRTMLSVDHCHKTGKVRGLLCSTCNIALGAAQDDITLLQNAIEYLRKNG